jgi:hypothetical protein
MFKNLLTIRDPFVQLGLSSVRTILITNNIHADPIWCDGAFKRFNTLSIPQKHIRHKTIYIFTTFLLFRSIHSINVWRL